MKKFYCEQCGSMKIIPECVYKKIAKVGEEGGVRCSFCSSGLEKLCMKSVPGYETPEQYKKRTGKAFNEHGLVWVKGTNKWFVNEYCFVPSEKREEGMCEIADPPIPPVFK